MTAFTALSFVVAGALAFAPAGSATKAGAATPAATTPKSRAGDPRERRQFALLAAGTATGVVGLGGMVIGLIGVDRSRYDACEVPDDPSEPVLAPQTRCFEESEYARRHRNARATMIGGLAGGGALLLASAALITSGLVIRHRRARTSRVELAPSAGPSWGAHVSVRF